MTDLSRKGKSESDGSALGQKRGKPDERFSVSGDKKPLKAKEIYDIMCFTGKGALMCAAKVKKNRKRKEKS